MKEDTRLSTLTTLKKSASVSKEDVVAMEGRYGDLSVIHSKRTGLATGHAPTTVEGAKRINWVSAYARSNHLTHSKVLRILLNEAIDRRMDADKLQGGAK